MSTRRDQVQKRVDTNEEQVLLAPNDPLAELVANSEVRDALLLLARTVTAQLKQQNMTLDNASEDEGMRGSKRKVSGGKQPQGQRPNIPNQRSKMDKGPMVKINPQCPKCGRNHRSKCLAGSD